MMIHWPFIAGHRRARPFNIAATDVDRDNVTRCQQQQLFERGQNVAYTEEQCLGLVLSIHNPALPRFVRSFRIATPRSDRWNRTSRSAGTTPGVRLRKQNELTNARTPITLQRQHFPSNIPTSRPRLYLPVPIPSAVESANADRHTRWSCESRLCEARSCGRGVTIVGQVEGTLNEKGGWSLGIRVSRASKLHFR